MWDEITTNQIVFAGLLSMLVSLAAWQAGALTAGGAVAAFGVGGVTFGIGGWGAAVVLLSFFVSSSLLSRMFGSRKKELEETVSKGARRDWAQVLANGGVAAVCLLMYAIVPERTWVMLAFAGSLAAANADTWATELGVLSPSPPRLLTSGRRVARGVSGGVSGLGLFASLLGAVLIAGAAWLVFESSWRMFVSVCAAGVLGGLFDSLLGASLQAVFYCPVCEKETERHPRHSCGELTVYRRGILWLRNDAVNLGCTLFGGLAAVLIYLLL